MKRNSRIAGFLAVASVSLVLAACDRRSEREDDLEDRITELEDENRHLREQLEETGSLERDAVSAPRAARRIVREAPDPMPRSIERMRPSTAPATEQNSDGSAAEAAARNAAEAARDAQEAAKP